MKKVAVWVAFVICLAARAGAVVVDYPLDGSVFPPEITPPTFLWRDRDATATRWRIDIAFRDGSPDLHFTVPGERMRIGEIDPRCISDTNELPKLTPEQAAAHTWIPGAGTWATIKRHSTEKPATITIAGLRGDASVSLGRVTISTSKDPVGAPIFYRDVPLMPAETQKGVIQPLAAGAIRLIRWRIRNVGEPVSHTVIENMPTCANCHSFSADGKTLGMDLDGPQNNKGMYTLAAIRPEMSIRTGDVIEWSSSKGPLVGKMRIGFMSQISPDGRFVVTRVNGLDPDPGQSATGPDYYVANFTNYKFLQVFYPTRGILAWYSRTTGRLQPLPGADDRRYVQTSAFWSPDGKYLVFGRAEAKDAYPQGAPLAKFANDPNERQIQFSLYRIPFNEGRGGVAEAVPGASGNGLSNNFPKVSPDGKWIVFVRCRNGQLMRPDSQLYIVPFAGGEARRMRCNTPLMNSWHSFSPNGRWLVFSSKSRSPFTRMFLTHIDEQGNDSPAILIDNPTEANRAVNIPEFVNIPADGLRKINVPAVDFYKLIDAASELMGKGQYQESASAWRKVLATQPRDANAHNNLAMTLAQTGQLDDAITHYRKATELKKGFVQAQSSLGSALAMKGRLPEAIAALRRAVEMDPGYASAHNNLGLALFQTGLTGEAISEFQLAAALKPGLVSVHSNLGSALATKGRLPEAIVEFRKSVELDPKQAQARFNLGVALSQTGAVQEAIVHFRKALEINPQYAQAHYSLGDALYAAGQTAGAVQHWREGLRLQ
ncbi:MAG: tetratricopeptide repeat protein, partial [Acidobacteria bacterium]|nr:tetratricopeptide repeat protein [Acidobacteriota bacterium]